MKKHLFVTLLILAVCRMMAQEAPKVVGKFTEPGDWRRAASFVKTQEGALRINTSGKLIGINRIHVNPEKSYRITMKARKAADSKPSLLLVIFEPYTEEGGFIAMNHVADIRNSHGILAKDVAEGSSEIFVRPDNPKAYAPIKSWVICFNAKEDFSDLPNSDISSNIQAMEAMEDGTKKITFRAPLKKAYKAGTHVRIHAGGAYIYVGQIKQTSDEWTDVSHVVKGIQRGWSNTTFPVGTATFTVGLLANWGSKGTAVEIKDLMIEEL